SIPDGAAMTPHKARFRFLVCWILALAALLVARPREARAGTFTPPATLEVTFSLDSTCGDPGDSNVLTVAAGTPVWVCHKVTNPQVPGAVTLFSVQIQDPQAPVPNSRTLPPGSFSFYRAAIIAGAATTTYSFTATGTNSLGD